MKFTYFCKLIFFHRSLNIIHVRGKRGRQVPVLFNKEEEDALKLLIKTRENAGVHQDNPYVFATPTRGSLRPLRGNDCLKKTINNIPSLQFPDRIKSTQLRKYCATVSQIADLDETQLRWLADHLGHNLDVHREFYRLRDSTIELSKVSRVLLAMDEGKGKDFSGKKLSDIKVNGMYTFISSLLYFNVMTN